mmetsp:Transcript_2781/g.4309  ORF Transcript_2781/g.4309 Transcript_2781/m.4309 type:complete len:285 (+) Transcript_2781:618-1472(+)
MLVVPLIPVWNVAIILHQLEVPGRCAMDEIAFVAHHHVVVPVVQLVRPGIEHPSALFVALVPEPDVLAMGHAHGMHSHDRHGLVRTEVEVLLEVSEQLVRREVVRGHVDVWSSHSRDIGAAAVLAADVSHGKVVPVRTTVHHGQVGADQRRQRPNIRATVTLLELAHDGVDRLDGLGQSLVVRIVHVDASVASADAVVKAQAEELGYELAVAVVDELGDVGTDVVDVGLVVAVVVPAVGVPSGGGVPSVVVAGNGGVLVAASYPSVAGPILVVVDATAAAIGAG